MGAATAGGWLSPLALIRCLAVPAATVLMASCAWLSPDRPAGESAVASQCPVDWRAFGAAQGERGHRAGVVEQALADCPVPEPQRAREAFVAGHAEGLSRYCTTALQYARGREGLSFRNVCLAEDSEALRTAHADGVQVREQRQALKEQRERLRHLEQFARVGSAQPSDRERFGDPPIAERATLREAERALYQKDHHLSRRYGAEPLID